MKGLEDLRKQLEIIEKALGRETIILGDDSKWSPRIPLLDMFVFLMECECSSMAGESPPGRTPELIAEAKKWAEYERRPNEPPFYGMMSDMARNLITRGE